MALLLVLGLWGKDARAACADQAPDPSNDLSLECLIAKRATGVSSAPTLQEQSYYRSLVSELAAAMSVPALHPADTVGFSGFHFSFDSTLTSVSQDAPWWTGRPENGGRADAGVRRFTGAGNFLPVLSIMLRKGIWMPLPPLPSVELGAGASNIVNSSIFALTGYFKFAIHEGYHRFPVPSFALRGSVTRLAGASQLDLTIINADALISKAFGVGGTFTLQPYIGGGVLFGIFRSQVIDTAPAEDLYRGAPLPAPPLSDAQRLAYLDHKIVFPTQDNLFRWRAFGGLQLNYAIIAFTASYSFFGAGQDAGFELGTLPTPAMANQPAADRSAACRQGPDGVVCPKDVAAYQHQIALSLGLRF